jgi:hypothetical protein
MYILIPISITVILICYLIFSKSSHKYAKSADSHLSAGIGMLFDGFKGFLKLVIVTIIGLLTWVIYFGIWYFLK